MRDKKQIYKAKIFYIFIYCIDNVLKVKSRLKNQFINVKAC